MAEKLSPLQFDVLRLLRNGISLVQLLEQYLRNEGYWFIELRLRRNLGSLEGMKLVEAVDGDLRRFRLTSKGRERVLRESMKK